MTAADPTTPSSPATAPAPLPPPAWACFLSASDEAGLAERVAGHPGLLTRYRVEALAPIVGPRVPPLPVRPGDLIARVESSSPWTALTVRAASAGEPVLLGVTQHLHYTSADQKVELDRRSAKPLPASPDTLAVLIPIRKSAAWWRLAHDERQAHFRTAHGHGPHTAIGLEYVERIFRRLYHARYLGTRLPYDFLTYFELRRGEEDVFRALLAALRDPERNPEWAFVEWELEIWLTKLDETSA